MSKRLPPKLPSGQRMVPNKYYKSTRSGKKMMIYVVRKDKSKLIHFGDKAYRHNYSAAAKKSYLARSAGIRDKSGKLTKDNVFSPNYHSRKRLWPS
jgi:TFIIF-interacting CTD phosphatase-like protein